MGSTIKTRRGYRPGSTNPTLKRSSGPALDESYMLVPMLGIRDKGAELYVQTLIRGDRVHLEVRDGSVVVRHQNREIGWLDASHDAAVARELRKGRVLRAEMYAVGGADDAPTAVLAIWL